MRLRKLTIAEVEFRLECLPEEETVRGNALASGDDAADKACEDEILARLDAGDQWAWCLVKLTTSWQGVHVTDYLGQCSYRDEADFREDEGLGYFSDMKRSGLDALNAELEARFYALRPLLEEG